VLSSPSLGYEGCYWCWSLCLRSYGLVVGLEGTMSLYVWMLLSIWLFVVVYACWYSASDSGLFRLVFLLTGFTSGMVLIMVSSGLVELFLGWEIIGIASLLLVGYYRSRVDGVLSGLKALLYNRIGDIGVLVGLTIVVGIQCDCGLDLLPSSCLYAGQLGYDSYFCLASMGFIVGCWCKSAMIGFHSWLLDAMEGPTPVSALLHSATLVCAGICLLGKVEVLLAYTGTTGMIVCIGVSSCMVASWLGNWFMDVKRVVAYSTMVHVGLMLTCMGVTMASEGFGFSSVFLGSTGLGSSGLEHLFTHSWSKALLFMCVGAILHLLLSQDLRSLGTVWVLQPLLCSIAVIAGLSVMGILGSYIGSSKEFVLGSLVISHGVSGYVVAVLVLFSCGYSIGLVLSLVYDMATSVTTSVIARGVSLGCVLPLVVMVLHVLLLPSALGVWVSSGRFGSVELLEWFASSGSHFVVDSLGFLLLWCSLLSGVLWSSSGYVFLATSGLLRMASVNRLWFDRLFNSVLCWLQSFYASSIVGDVEYGVGAMFLGTYSSTASSAFFCLQVSASVSLRYRSLVCRSL